MSNLEAIVAAKASVVDGWAQGVRAIHPGEPIIVGFDCQWGANTVSYMNNKTATLQLWVNTKSLILQLFHMDYIPQSIKNFLNVPRNTFVGVEVDEDVAKLTNEYMLTCNKTVDIQSFGSRWP